MKTIIFKIVIGLFIWIALTGICFLFFAFGSGIINPLLWNEVARVMLSFLSSILLVITFLVTFHKEMRKLE